MLEIKSADERAYVRFVPIADIREMKVVMHPILGLFSSSAPLLSRSNIIDVEIVRALASSGVDPGGNCVDALTIDVESTQNFGRI